MCSDISICTTLGAHKQFWMKGELMLSRSILNTLATECACLIEQCGAAAHAVHHGMHCSVDLSGEVTLDIFDVSAFLDAYDAGCQ